MNLPLVYNKFVAVFIETYENVSLDEIHWTVPGLVSCPVTYTTIVGVRL